jgi:hypothetical protein
MIMMMRFTVNYLLCFVTLWTGTTTAFVPPSPLLSYPYNGAAAGVTTISAAPITHAKAATTTRNPISTTTTTLMERRWNFNEGQAPWGMKKNAETWNGRVAQMAFVLVFLQELIQGKGVVQGLLQGDPVNLACASAFAVVVVGLTGWLALQGDDDYVARDM